MTAIPLKERLLRTVARTSITYGLLAPGDRILVAVSGGKDSYGLLHLLHHLRARLPFSVELLAMHVHQGQPGVDTRPLEDWLAQSGIPFDIAREDTWSVVQRNVGPTDTPCPVCARMRRGILNTRARRHGCTKIALGHHREDTLATFLMNLFYSGRLQAMPAKYTVDEGDLQVIRPLIEVAEADLISLAGEMAFPIVPCALCSNIEDHKRRRMNELMDLLSEEHPALKSVMLGALKNVKPSHLLDLNLQRTSDDVTAVIASETPPCESDP